MVEIETKIEEIKTEIPQGIPKEEKPIEVKKLEKVEVKVEQKVKSLEKINVKLSGEKFKRVVKVCSSFVDDVLMKFTPEGLQAKALDASQIALFDMFIPKSDFLTYPIGKGEEFSIGVDCQELAKRAKYFSDKDLELMMDKSISVYQLDEYERTLNSKGLDISNAQHKPPVISNFTSTINVSGKDFAEVMKEVDNKEIEISVNNGKVFFTGKDDVMGYAFGINDGKLKGGNVSVSFMTDYIQKLKNCGGKGKEEMQIQLKKSAPLKATIRIGNGGKCDIYIAPRTEEND